MDVVDREDHASRRRSYEVANTWKIDRAARRCGGCHRRGDRRREEWVDLDRGRTEIFTLMVFGGFRLQFWRPVKAARKWEPGQRATLETYTLAE